MNDKTALNQAIKLTDEILEVLDQGEFERVNQLDLMLRMRLDSGSHRLSRL